MDPRIRQTARVAAEMIEKDGWCRGLRGRRAGGQRCAMMAIIDAAENVNAILKPHELDGRSAEDLAFRVRRRAERIVDPNDRRIHLKNRGKKLLAFWNDHIAADAAEVVRLLRRVAKGGGRHPNPAARNF